MTDLLTPEDRAALLAPVHRVVTETHACETCGGLGSIERPEGWIPCLPCLGWGFISTEYRQEVA